MYVIDFFDARTHEVTRVTSHDTLDTARAAVADAARKVLGPDVRVWAGPVSDGWYVSVPDPAGSPFRVEVGTIDLYDPSIAGPINGTVHRTHA